MAIRFVSAPGNICPLVNKTCNSGVLPAYPQRDGSHSLCGDASAMLGQKVFSGFPEVSPGHCVNFRSRSGRKASGHS